MIIHKCDICGREIKPENTFLFKMCKGHKTESFEFEICAYCKNDIQKVIESRMKDAENSKK